MTIMTYLACVGDMLVKKTRVFLGSMFNFAHLNILFIAIRYASSVDNSTISFSSSSNDPFLYTFMYIQIKTKYQPVSEERIQDLQFKQEVNGEVEEV